MDIVCAAVLFDCDGVLVDSRSAGEHAWTTWAAEHDVPIEDVMTDLHGRRSAETVARFVPPSGRAAALARIEEIEIAGARDVPAIRGAGELLAALPANWAVVTSGSPDLLAARVAGAGLPQPPVAITAADVSAGKPDPEGYRSAAARLGCAPDECVVFEDSVAGVAAGQAAGVHQVVGVGEAALATSAAVVVTDLASVSWVGDRLVFERSGLLRG